MHVRQTAGEGSGVAVQKNAGGQTKSELQMLGRSTELNGKPSEGSADTRQNFSCVLKMTPELLVEAE